MTSRFDKWLILQILTFAVILLGTPFTRVPLSIAIIIFGSILFFAGAVVIATAFFYLDSNLTPFVKPKEKGSLITSGIYSFVRHPMYMGGIILAFGWAMSWGSLLGIAFSAVLFFVLDRKASEEEKWLTEKHPEYANYKKRVKKIIPFIY